MPEKCFIFGREVVKLSFRLRNAHQYFNFVESSTRKLMTVGKL